jgi:hypothetical protein
MPPAGPRRAGVSDGQGAALHPPKNLLKKVLRNLQNFLCRLRRGPCRVRDSGRENGMNGVLLLRKKCAVFLCPNRGVCFLGNGFHTAFPFRRTVTSFMYIQCVIRMCSTPREAATKSLGRKGGWGSGGRGKGKPFSKGFLSPFPRPPEAKKSPGPRTTRAGTFFSHSWVRYWT